MSPGALMSPGSLQTFDTLLWSLAIALAVLALWLSRPRPREWEIGPLFEGILGRRDLREKPEAWQPAEWLGAGCTWEGLWSPTGPPSGATTVALQRRLSGLRLIWLEPPVMELPGLAAQQIAPPAQITEEGIGGAFEDQMSALMGEGRVVVAASAAAMPLLRLLLVAPGLRDRLAAVLLIDPAVEPEWAEVNFRHDRLDTELYRQVPWLILRHRLESCPLQTPPLPPTDRAALEIVDLQQHDPADPRLPHAVSLLLAAIQSG